MHATEKKDLNILHCSNERAHHFYTQSQVNMIIAKAKDRDTGHNLEHWKFS